MNALALEFGIERAYTSRRSNSLIPYWISREAADDDGTQIAERLGIPVRPFGHPGRAYQDYRPGRVAAKRLGVRSPLEEAGLGKEEIRTLSKMLNLPTWDKPSFACLSSRFPYNEKITELALRQVEKAEDYLWQLGMRVFRVRHHDTIARLELGEKEMDLVSEGRLREQIVQYFKSLGYKYVTLDMEGYRTGSMNETLTGIDDLVKNL